MDILLIGNGFDLAHGLQTDYGSFLRFLKLISYYCEASGKSMYSQRLKYNFCLEYVDDLFMKRGKDVIRNFLVHAAKENIWIKYFQSIYTERESKGKIGWIDFESEISSIVQVLDEIRQLVSKDTIFHDREIRVPEVLVERIEPFIDRERYSYGTRRLYFSLDQIEQIENYLVDDLNELTRCLEIYLTDFIGRQNVIKRLPDIMELHPDRVLSFNYTNTCEKYYFPESEDIIYDYIHGKAILENTVDTSNMVLGIDEYLQENERRRIDFIRFKKYYQRIYKKTGCAYREWLEDMISNREKMYILGQKNYLYIFGHSLDVTDADVVSSLIMEPNMITTIFYHDQKAYSQQIANLVRMIGPDNLTEMVHGSNPRIIFKQQDAVKIEN